MRTPFYHQGILVDEPQKVFEEYIYSKKFFYDLLTALPLNLIIWNFENVSQYKYFFLSTNIFILEKFRFHFNYQGF
jgi:hypothetical protein